MGVHNARRYCSSSSRKASNAQLAKAPLALVELKKTDYYEEAYSSSSSDTGSAADDVAGDIANIPNAKCDNTDATIPYEEDDDTAGSGGGGGCGGAAEKFSYKAKRHIGKSAQSVLGSLAASSVLLVSLLLTFWNWLASRLNVGLNILKKKKSKSTSANTFCANSHCSRHSSIIEKSEVFQQKSSIIPSSESEKMTIEVADIMTAIVNPEEVNNYSSSDQEEEIEEDSSSASHILRMKSSGKNHLSATSGGGLPVLRLNSESFEDNNLLLSSSRGSLEEGELLMFEEDDGTSSTTSSSENNHHHSSSEEILRRDQDSCSDYCSGSGSLSGSPIPDHHLENLDRRHHEIDSVVNSSSSSSSSVLIRRDSDTSDSSVNEDEGRNKNSSKAAGGANSSGEVGPELKAKIISQVESMFSDEHLEKDGFLLKHVRRRSDGFVSLKLVAGLRKVKQLSREFSTVLVALQESEKLEVNSEGTKIRRKEPLTPVLKSLPIKQAKKEKSQGEKENQGGSSSNGNNSSAEEQQNISIIRTSNQGNKENNGKNGMKNQRNTNGASPAAYNGINANNNRKNSSNGQQQYPNKVSTSRKNSNTSTASSNVNSRNGSFSCGNGNTAGGRPHPADLFRHMMNSTSAGSSGEDSPQVIRRRGGSLPINTGHRGSIGGHNNLSPNSSPPSNVPAGFLRPKSNSYCEGTTNQQATTTTGMSPWLLKRKASAVSRSSNGDIVISGVIRQPRGPDGTNGFASGYRELILQDRLLTSVSECSTTFSA